MYVVWASLGRHPGVQLLIQHLTRLAAPEGIGSTPNGLALGKYARPTLYKLTSATLENPVSFSDAKTFLENDKPLRPFRPPEEKITGIP